MVSGRDRFFLGFKSVFRFCCFFVFVGIVFYVFGLSFVGFSVSEFIGFFRGRGYSLVIFFLESGII